MSPWLDDGDVRLYHGDALDVLAGLPDGSVDCVVTSPPYWGLRDYGTGAWDGGDPDCDHQAPKQPDRKFTNGRGENAGYAGTNLKSWTDRDGTTYRDRCGKCGATRIDQQLGLEPTPDLFVQNMVAVFREIRRVLADHGTCWVNLGDSYAHNNTTRRTPDEQERELERDADKGYTQAWQTGTRAGWRDRAATGVPAGLKQKDLVGMPWRVAFALQADGWYLRSDIIWAKPNPMPESVTDRPTKAHEFVFLLTKAPWKGRAPGPIEAALSPEDARWLALLLDTEGNISVKRVAPQEGKSPQYGAQIAIGSTSRLLLERVAQIVGAGNINERAGTNAPMFYWQVSNKVAQDLLYAVYPHLIVKPRQARIAIHLESLLYHRGNATHRTDAENATLESLWLRNKECNQFGEPDLGDVPEPKYGKWGASRYWFDTEAVREQYQGYDGRTKTEISGASQNGERAHENYANREGHDRWPGTGRNVRSVWNIATQPYPEAHFATFPEELARRCILAGCPVRVCGVCGKPSERIVDVTPAESHREPGSTWQSRTDAKFARGGAFTGRESEAVGWSDCGHNNWRPGTVLDPFIGSGTTAKVARDHQRHAIGIDLSADYLALAARRLQQLSLLT